MKTFQRSSITNRHANEIVAQGQAKAADLGVPSVFAVVDDSGVIKLLSRMDGAALASVQVAEDKAYSAVATGVPTHLWHGIAESDPSFGFGLAAIDRLCPIGGGYPIELEGGVVGGFGVSGGTVEQDMQVAAAALGLEEEG